MISLFGIRTRDKPAPPQVCYSFRDAKPEEEEPEDFESVTLEAIDSYRHVFRQGVQHASNPADLLQGPCHLGRC